MFGKLLIVLALLVAVLATVSQARFYGRFGLGGYGLGLGLGYPYLASLYTYPYLYGAYPWYGGLVGR